MNLNVLYYQSIQDLVTLCSEGREISLTWKDFKEMFPNVFSVDEIISFNYEPEKNFFVVERLGYPTSGFDQPEIQWISQNFDQIKEKIFLYQRKQEIYSGSQHREHLFYSTAWLIERHREQIELNITTTLSNDQYNSLLLFRQQLRDMGEVFDMSQPYETLQWPERPI